MDRRPELIARKMFGYPAGFVGGHLATCLHEHRWIVRLPDDARAELLREPGAAHFEPMPGRPMKEYVVLPQAIVGDPPALDGWVDRADRVRPHAPRQGLTPRGVVGPRSSRPGPAGRRPRIGDRLPRRHLVNVALESIGRDLPATLVGTLEGLTYVTGGYLAVLAAFLIPAGALSDAYGRRRVFGYGLSGSGSPLPRAVLRRRWSC